MSGSTPYSNPSSLGGGMPGLAPRLLGGGGGSTGGSGVSGGSLRSMTRFRLRNAFGKTNLNPNPAGPTIRPICGPFRAAFNAGDRLGLFGVSAGGANQVTSVNAAKNPGWKSLAGGVGTEYSGRSVSVGGLVFVVGTAPGQTQLQSGNPRYVYDGSDFTRFKKLAAINQNYNDLTFGGPAKGVDGGTASALARARM